MASKLLYTHTSYPLNDCNLQHLNVHKSVTWLFEKNGLSNRFPYFIHCILPFSISRPRHQRFSTLYEPNILPNVQNDEKLLSRYDCSMTPLCERSCDSNALGGKLRYLGNNQRSEDYDLTAFVTMQGVSRRSSFIIATATTRSAQCAAKKVSGILLHDVLKVNKDACCL